LVDAVFGPADLPGDLRQVVQLLLNYKHGMLRAGEALSLAEFLEQQGEGDDEALIHRLTYALLRKVERERRTIVGPARKPPDRVVEEVLRSPKLQETIRELAGPGFAERALLTDKARDMLREMQTIPDPETQGSLELLAERVLDRVYSGLDVDLEGLESLRKLRADGSVVLLPSHKSHVDYIVLSFILRQHNIQIPVIAAGDNLSFFPAGPLLRRCGAFFIRRSFRGDRLYTAVVDAYVRRLLRDGFMIEVFLEGGRSRTGKLLPPMLGLLNMVVASALGLESRKVYFQPVSIGYERLMEEGAFARELSGEQKQKEDAAQLLKLPRVLSDRWGRINIQFGEPIELGALRRALGNHDDDLSPAKRRAVVKRLAHRAMHEINRVTAVTPGALIAMVLLSHARRGVPYRDLLAHCRRLSVTLSRLGARQTPSLVTHTGELRESGVREVLTLYVRSGLIEQHVPGDTLTAESKKRAALYTGTDVIFTMPPAKRIRLDLAKNQILHWLVDRALIAVGLLCGPEPQEPADRVTPWLRQETLRARVLALSRLYKYEFMFRVDAPFDRIFDEVLADMVAQGELARDGERVVVGPGRDGLDGLGWVTFFAALVRNFIDAYRVAARSLGLLVKGPLEEKELVARALRAGERMFLQGEIERSEAVCRPVLVNALTSFVDQGYLVREKSSLALSDTFRSEEGAAAVEARVSAYLAGQFVDTPWG
jgi:glycerol-3-phosphate O-acyltransferase